MSDLAHLKIMAERRDAILKWLSEQAPHAEFEQKHLDADSSERAYWHHGYQAALTDILKLACAEVRAPHKMGRPN